MDFMFAMQSAREPDPQLGRGRPGQAGQEEGAQEEATQTGDKVETAQTAAVSVFCNLIIPLPSNYL